MSIYKHARQAYKHELKKDFLEDKYLPKTLDGLLEYLFDQDIRYTGYVVYKDKEECSKTTTTQRLNRLWITPLWILYSPFGWLFKGNAGIRQHGKLGKWVSKMTGL